MSENSDLRATKRATRVEQNAAKITPEMANVTFPTLEDFLKIKQKAQNNSLEIKCNSQEVETSFQEQIQEAIKRFVLQTNVPNLRGHTTFYLDYNNQNFRILFHYDKSLHSIAFRIL